MWTFHEGELDETDVQNLLEQHIAEMNAGSPPSACHVLAADALKHDSIRFFTLRERGELLGCGALRRLDHVHGEIKSMRTDDHALGRGAGGAVLEHLIAEARANGMNRLSLETGNSEMFAAANRLYRREGFVSCGPFGGYRPSNFTLFYTRTI